MDMIVQTEQAMAVPWGWVLIDSGWMREFVYRIMYGKLTLAGQ